jgi:hypothetical protein
MAKKAVETSHFPAALGESIKASIQSLEVQINLLKQALGGGKAAAADATEDEPEEEDEKPAKKGKAASFDEEEEEAEEPAEEEEDEEPVKKKKGAKAASFDEEEEEEGEDEKPAKKGKTKVTLDDVNDACKERARNSNRAEALGILKKKFKVDSVSDLKPEQYEAVIKAMKK